MPLWLADYQSVDDYHLYGVFTTREKAVGAIGFDPAERDYSKVQHRYWIEKIDLDTEYPR